jgi:hypothetical protein
MISQRVRAAHVAGSHAKNADGILHDRGGKTIAGDGLFQKSPEDKR